MANSLHVVLDFADDVTWFFLYLLVLLWTVKKMYHALLCIGAQVWAVYITVCEAVFDWAWSFVINEILGGSFYSIKSEMVNTNEKLEEKAYHAFSVR